MLKNEHIDQVNAKMIAYLTQCLKDYHGQKSGVRVIEITTSRDDLNPPGYKYNVKLTAQVTLDPEKKDLPS